MVDDVARALCDMAGRSSHDALSHLPRVGPLPSPECITCENGECTMWECFRHEARAAIVAAHRWHKKERRWPGFVSG